MDTFLVNRLNQSGIVRRSQDLVILWILVHLVDLVEPVERDDETNLLPPPAPLDLFCLHFIFGGTSRCIGICQSRTRRTLCEIQPLLRWRFFGKQVVNFQLFNQNTSFQIAKIANIKGFARIATPERRVCPLVRLWAGFVQDHQLEHHEHDAKAIFDHELHGTTFSGALRRIKKASGDLSFSRTPRKEKQMFAKVFDLCGLWSLTWISDAQRNVDASPEHEVFPENVVCQQGPVSGDERHRFGTCGRLRCPRTEETSYMGNGSTSRPQTQLSAICIFR